MEKSSLAKLRNKIIDIIHGLDINPIDKGELAINLYHFLDEEKYSKNIEVLKQKSKPESNGGKMDKEALVVSKKLYDSVVNENIKLKIIIANQKQQIDEMIQKKEQPMKNQITIDEWQKTLKKENKHE